MVQVRCEAAEEGADVTNATCTDSVQHTGSEAESSTTELDAGAIADRLHLSTILTD